MGLRIGRALPHVSQESTWGAVAGFVTDPSGRRFIDPFLALAVAPVPGAGSNPARDRRAMPGERGLLSGPGATGA